MHHHTTTLSNLHHNEKKSENLIQLYGSFDDYGAAGLVVNRTLKTNNEKPNANLSSCSTSH